MQKLQFRVYVAAAVVAAVLAACGGGGGGDTAGDPVAAPAEPGIADSVTALLAFMNRLIAGTDETSEPIDINALGLAVDDTAEPVAF